MKIGLHLASLYYMHDNYETTLRERVNDALNYGCEHIEISNGPSLMKWRPTFDIPVSISVHAEVYRDFDITPASIIEHVVSWNIPVEYIVWHPNELETEDWSMLQASPIPCLIENMDSKKLAWQSVAEMQDIVTRYGLGICLDIAHIESNGMNLFDFTELPIQSVHASRSLDNTHCLLVGNGEVILPEAPFYIIEGIVYAWENLAAEIAILKSARDAFLAFRKRYPEHHITSGNNGITIIGEVKYEKI